jgi:hypothetical protein
MEDDWGQGAEEIFAFSKSRLQKLYNKSLHNLYPSPDIIRVKRLRWMRWTGYVPL